MSDVKGKVAIVTGAGRGIGRGIALAYGAAGLKVAVASRTRSTVDSVTKEITDAGGTAVGITCDVGRRDQVYAMVEQAVKAFGTVDVLVNNAQGFGTDAKPAPTPNLQPLESFDEAEFEYTLRTGAWATLWGMKAAFPYLKNRGGKIINFGSNWGQVGYEGSAAYNATKEAIRGLTRTAAREWGKYGITAYVINPSVQSDAMAQFQRDHPEEAAAAVQMVPLRRWGDPVRDAGGLALFLASSASDYVTGMTFMLEGGWHMFP
ncbi:MAG: SDR family NAD(P)-dependent oxidoreductase [Gammaproteobacteria bacterium]